MTSYPSGGSNVEGGIRLRVSRFPRSLADMRSVNRYVKALERALAKPRQRTSRMHPQSTRVPTIELTIVTTRTKSSFGGGGGGSSSTGSFRGSMSMGSKMKTLHGCLEASHTLRSVRACASRPSRIACSSSTAFSSRVSSLPKLIRTSTSITPVGGGSPPICSSRLRASGMLPCIPLRACRRHGSTSVSRYASSPSLMSQCAHSAFSAVHTPSPGIRSRLVRTTKCDGGRWRRRSSSSLLLGGASTMERISTEAGTKSRTEAMASLM
mmetsp:Transcript_72819/g.152092  ORF Transcript_72819/g.152092 Transcript_72819/m.152092 type:complete len:267 (-) Transcript_72819:197-997(-)